MAFTLFTCQTRVCHSGGLAFQPRSRRKMYRTQDAGRFCARLASPQERVGARGAPKKKLIACGTVWSTSAFSLAARGLFLDGTPFSITATRPPFAGGTHSCLEFRRCWAP